MKIAKFVQKNRYWILHLVILGVLLSWTSHGFAQKIDKFSGDFVIIDSNGRVKFTGKIFVTPQKIRIDRIPPAGKNNIIMILRRDLNVQWILNPVKKTYTSKPLDEKKIETIMKKYQTSKNERVLGTQKVSGIDCVMKRVEANVNIQGSNMKASSTLWVSPKLDLPIRTQFWNGSISELRNIMALPPKDQLFDLPQGYRKVSTIGELFR